jgi:hypothetical protein
VAVAAAAMIVIGTDVFKHLHDSACRCSSQRVRFITSKTGSL